MFRIALGTMAALTLAPAAPPAIVQAQSHSASRTFQASWASPDSELRVNISASNYGPFGQVVETLPSGFSYVRSSVETSEVDVDGQTVQFTLFGVSSFYYVVRVPAEEGQHTFSGVITKQRPTGAHRRGTHPAPCWPAAHANTIAHPNTHLDADAHSNSHPHTHAVADPNAYSHAHAVADPNAHTESQPRRPRPPRRRTSRRRWMHGWPPPWQRPQRVCRHPPR